MSTIFKGIVKSVLSGDTVVVTNKQGGEKELTLTGINAPRLGRRDGQQDEPFAFQSREFLRKNLVGKGVEFRIVGVSKQGTRSYVEMRMGGVDVAEKVVENGWASVKVRNSKEGQESNNDDNPLVALQTQAQENGVGMWDKSVSDNEKIRNLVTSFDQQAFLEAHKGEELEGLVEYVRDGSTFRLLLGPYNDHKLSKSPTYYSIQFFLAGVQSPGYRRVETSSAGASSSSSSSSVSSSSSSGGFEYKPEPYANEARTFVESRLLHRTVTIILEGLDRRDNFFGTLLHAQGGNISLHLLNNGLAKTVDWSLTQCAFKNELRQAEASAKSKQLKLWKGYVKKQRTIGSLKEFTGTVVEVVSGDCVVVFDTTDNVDRKVYLASVRAPRMGRGNNQNEDYAYEAKEFVRNRLIGKKVKAIVDYQKVIERDEGDNQKMTYVTIIVNNMNIAEYLLKSGYARVQRHRRDDEDRSMFYDQLLDAEADAENKKKGLHNEKAVAPKHHMNDLSRNKVSAKSMFGAMQREGSISALVEYEFNGARFKLCDPKQNVMFMFVLSGIRCPMLAKKQDKGDDKPKPKDEPFAKEALEFVRKGLHQRYVEVEVENQDNYGTFIGTMMSAAGSNVAIDLLERGFASLHSSVEYCRWKDEMIEAEAQAKKARKGIWVNYEEKQEIVTVSDESQDGGKQKVEQQGPEVLAVQVIELVDGAHFFAKLVDDVWADLEKAIMSTSMEGASVASNPQIGPIYVAKFTQDGEWYRCKIVDIIKETKKAVVVYIDYGNSEALPLDQIYDPVEESIRKVPGLAHECYLAHLVAPSLIKDEDWAEESADYFASLAMDKVLTATVQYRSGNVLYVVLTDSEGVDINMEMVKEGLASVEEEQNNRRGGSWGKKNKSTAVKKALLDAQAVAFDEKRNLWQYGEFRGEDF
eukprot:TRINITY_DN4466_c0_g1_i1.p1 TRINITY_DN4466_c0_g1~~TRINITY_DN4466_c0_g1_i1.p1  ORF type:complete len:930 (-),score=377.11 TRINITY_DN4466_c0_g1_i1:96-2855(-)